MIIILASKGVRIPTQAAVGTSTRTLGNLASGAQHLVGHTAGAEQLLLEWPTGEPGWILALPLSSCVALGRLLDLSVLPLVPAWKRKIIVELSWRINEFICENHFEEWPAPRTRNVLLQALF